jgi:hypothetical protein
MSRPRSGLAEEAEKVHVIGYSYLSRFFSMYGFWVAIVVYNVLALGNVLKT